MLESLLTNAGLPSAVYVCDVPVASAAILLLLLFLMLLAFQNKLVVGGSSTVADFPTDSGGPAAVEIHDVHLVPMFLLPS